MLTKTRWMVDGWPGLVDVFEGKLAGLVVLEAEGAQLDEIGALSTDLLTRTATTRSARRAMNGSKRSLPCDCCCVR